MSALLRFICEDSGPTAVEYAVMLMMIISVCVGAIGAIGTLADGFFTDAKQTFGSAD
ncbi:MAG: Flp family type IVb pilin [Planctomycetota bacterium]|nr:MAG: Flp family type IVb pilin [Planctomycetota bacterium]